MAGVRRWERMEALGFKLGGTQWGAQCELEMEGLSRWGDTIFELARGSMEGLNIKCSTGGPALRERGTGYQQRVILLWFNSESGERVGGGQTAIWNG